MTGEDVLAKYLCLQQYRGTALHRNESSIRRGVAEGDQRDWEGGPKEITVGQGKVTYLEL